MIKFLITVDRCLQAATVPEYVGALSGNIVAEMQLLPKFLLDNSGEYIVEIIHDEDGDILEIKNLQVAMERMNGITPARFEKLGDELRAALRNIVNPPKGGGSKQQPSPESKQPPPG